jgi:hypothetical protein
MQPSHVQDDLKPCHATKPRGRQRGLSSRHANSHRLVLIRAMVARYKIKMAILSKKTSYRQRFSR